MTTNTSSLFQSLKVGHVTLPNRIVAPPMVQLRPITSTEGIAWYRRLAEGGSGLVIVEASGVPGLSDPAKVAQLRPLVQAIHDAGAAAAIQLFPVEFGTAISPDQLTAEQIDTIVTQYAQTAKVCLEAGFDGVQPHGAHGYLLNQFFAPEKNARTDDYAGSLGNRARLALRIVRAIREAAGDRLLILYRHTPIGPGYGMDDSLWFAEQLVAAGVDVLDISPAKDAETADLAAPFKAQFDVPIIAVGGMDEPEDAAAAIDAGRCDLVAVGRQLIADAEYPRKVRDGRYDDVRNCEHCNQGCFGNLKTQEPVACVLWDDDEVAHFVK